MRSIRKASGWLIAAIMILTAVFCAAETADPDPLQADGFTYELRTDAGTGETYAAVTGGTPAGSLVIPAEMGGYPVREVGDGFIRSAKEWTEALESLEVPDGVVRIGDKAFMGCRNLAAAKLPESLLEIGESAFQDCVSLREITLPASVVSVGEAALANIAAESLALPEGAAEQSSGFWYCSAIRKDQEGKWEYGLLGDGTAVITGLYIESKTLTIPGQIDGIDVTMIARAPLGKIDYNRLHMIQRMVLPKGLKAIEHSAFEYCINLKDVKLPAGLESIGYAAFRECKSLRSISIPAGIRRIGDYAFSSCNSMKNPAFPEGLEIIGRYAFNDCRSMTGVSLPASVRTIGERAFSFCQIGKLTLKEGLEKIGERAFYSHCLSNIVLPASVRAIGHAAFHPDKPDRIRSVTVSNPQTALGRGVFGYDDGWTAYYKAHRQEETPGGTSEYDREDPANWKDYYANSDNNGQSTVTFSCYPGSTADGLYQYHVKKSYLKGDAGNQNVAPADPVLHAGLYTNADGIYELVIPEGVEEIAEDALSGLGTLNKITLPSTLVRIGARAFENCIGLTEVRLPAGGMEEIGEAAFRGCSELKKINIPLGITEIRGHTFENCRNLASVSMPAAGLVRIGESAFAGCASLKELKLSSGLESIGTMAFANSGLKAAKIPDTVRTLGEKAFYGSKLASLTLPKDMEEIPESLCEFASALSQVTLPKNVRRIGKRAFALCRLGSLTLPEGLETIEEEAFTFEISVVYNYYRKYVGKKTIARLKALKLPASLKAVGPRAFAGNDALTSLSFAKGARLEEIGDEAFTLCIRLKNLTLPDSVRTVGKGAFSLCVKLANVNLGSGTEELKDEAFADCKELKSFTAPDSLVVIGADVLKKHGGKLKVTCSAGSAMEAYMAACDPEVSIVYPKKK